MGERVTVQVEHENLDPNLLLEKLIISNSGAIVSFTGLTRGHENGIKVHSLDFDAWEEQLPNVLRDLGNKSFYEFKNGLPKIHEHDNKAPQALAIFENERIVILYTYETDLGDGWEDATVHNNNEEKRDLALKMGVNIIYFALTQ